MSPAELVKRFFDAINANCSRLWEAHSKRERIIAELEPRWDELKRADFESGLNDSSFWDFHVWSLERRVESVRETTWSDVFEPGHRRPMPYDWVLDRWEDNGTHGFVFLIPSDGNTSAVVCRHPLHTDKDASSAQWDVCERTASDGLIQYMRSEYGEVEPPPFEHDPDCEDSSWCDCSSYSGLLAEWIAAVINDGTWTPADEWLARRSDTDGRG